MDGTQRERLRDEGKTVKYQPSFSLCLYISLPVTFGSIVVTLCAAMDYGNQQRSVESVGFLFGDQLTIGQFTCQHLLTALPLRSSVVFITLAFEPTLVLR
jgi:hypothetical protein